MIESVTTIAESITKPLPTAIPSIGELMIEAPANIKNPLKHSGKSKTPGCILDLRGRKDAIHLFCYPMFL